MKVAVLKTWLLVVLVAACRPGGNPPNDAGVTGVRIGGSVSNLEGQGLTLHLNGGPALAISANGPFTFPEPVERDSAYVVTVGQQPTSPAQTCIVLAGSGTASTSVVDVTVSCTTQRFFVRGTFVGLKGGGLTLRNNGGDPLTLFPTAEGSGSFSFHTPLVANSTYAVTIDQQPSQPSQHCELTGATGTVGQADVSSVEVRCTTLRFTVGGTISGLAGQAISLRLSTGETLTRSADGPFQFVGPVESGATYSVTIPTAPTGRLCELSGGTGRIVDFPVTSVLVRCFPLDYRVGGTVSGLAGTGLLLRNNGADDLLITANGAFTFPTPVAGNRAFSVTIARQPTSPHQTCTVTNGSGHPPGDVSNVLIECVTNTYTVGGSAFGIRSAGLTLRLNGGTPLPVDRDGSFVFPTPVASGASYTVTVSSNPPDRVCNVENGSGTIGAANVTNVRVVCRPPGDTRDTAIVLDLNQGDLISFSASTVGAAQDSIGPCSCTRGADVFYRFQLERPSIVYADGFGANWDNSLYLQNEAGISLTDAGMPGGRACSDDACSTTQAQITARLGTGTWFLVLSGCSSGTATVRFAHLPAPSGLITPLIPGSSFHSASLKGTSAVSPTCAPGAGPEHSYWWMTCPSSVQGNFSASTCAQMTYDSVLEQRTPGRPAQCNDDACGTQSTLSNVPIPAGANLHVLYVDSREDPDGGVYGVNVTRP